jgi:hypothetical protein
MIAKAIKAFLETSFLDLQAWLKKEWRPINQKGRMLFTAWQGQSSQEVEAVETQAAEDGNAAPRKRTTAVSPQVRDSRHSSPLLR